MSHKIQCQELSKIKHQTAVTTLPLNRRDFDFSAASVKNPDFIIFSEASGISEI